MDGTMKHTFALKGIKTADKIVQIAIDIIFIIILLIGVYFIVDTIYVFNNAKAAEVGAYKPNGSEDLAGLQKVAKDAIAWITIDDSGVDYPIMQGKDNVEYLNKDPYGDYSLAGSIFLDSRNKKDFSDYYSVVYGHHMSGGYMFGALDAFEDAKYFKEHQNGTLITERGKLPVKVLAFLYTDARDEKIFDPEGDHKDLLSYVESKAINKTNLNTKNKIVALTTCKSPTSTRRMILILMIDE